MIRTLVGAIVELAASHEQPKRVDALGDTTLGQLRRLVTSMWKKQQVLAAEVADLAARMTDSLTRAYTEQRRQKIATAQGAKDLVAGQLTADGFDIENMNIDRLLLPLSGDTWLSITSLKGPREAARDRVGHYLGISASQLQKQQAGRARRTAAMWFGVELTEADIASYLVSLFVIEPADMARITADILVAVEKREAELLEARQTGRVPGRRKTPWLNG